MGKDFAKSYKQILWEAAAQSHQLWSTLLPTLTNPSFILVAKGRITELEKKYPQLKK